ncbi:hypothetical protein D3C74_140780 [compost metagenome]
MNDLAYINGVLHGNGWCKQALSLRVKDYDFCKTFVDSVNRVLNKSFVPKTDERGFWLFRTSNRTGKLNYLLTYEPKGKLEFASWLKGLFDSEGNFQLTKIKGKNSFNRRIATYCTDLPTLEKAKFYLSELGIISEIKETKNSSTHIGTKVVYELRLKQSKYNYSLFSEYVGSSLERNRLTLHNIINSYVPDLSENRRQNQLKGAQSKHRKTMNETLPKVVEGIKLLIDQGIKPTQRACRVIPGYNSIQRYFPQNELIEMAMKL